ncbi:hypothetical protein X777_10391 [Ooceraea biroi]|uniref:Uncharacterized protein n=1 Tax=Ooceraea biroi TaxID=2015173 RepID=A0A026W533_OOCBI|nr:hypothetical protein X777_10391 [Ooceraea biroi]
MERARNTPDSTVDHRAIARAVHLRQGEREIERDVKFGRSIDRSQVMISVR